MVNKVLDFLLLEDFRNPAVCVALQSLNLNRNPKPNTLHLSLTLNIIPKPYT